MGTDQTTVVVTGLGATTPLGGDVRSTWEALLAGQSGARHLPDDWPADLPVRIAAPAAVDPATVLDRVQARRLDRCEQFAIVAAREAWADAGQPDAEPERIGVAVSSGIGGVASTIAAYDTLNSKGWQRLSPYTVPMLMPNGSAGWISIELGARAGVHTTVSACASGAEAIAYAIDMIRSGRAVRAACTADGPSWTTSIAKPSARSRAATASAMVRSSSTTRIRRLSSMVSTLFRGRARSRHTM